MPDWKAVRIHNSRNEGRSETNTKQECSQCGNIVKKSLAVRMHRCSCGFVANRDYNSALNILQRALGQELSEYTPVETELLLLSNQGQVQSQKQEAPCESVV